MAIYLTDSNLCFGCGLVTLELLESEREDSVSSLLPDRPNGT